MYKADQDFHRILLKLTADGLFEILRKTRVTYDVASSSYQSIRALRKCATFSEVTTEVQIVILREFFADDILAGAN